MTRKETEIGPFCSPFFHVFLAKNRSSSASCRRRGFPGGNLCFGMSPSRYWPCASTRQSAASGHPLRLDRGEGWGEVSIPVQPSDRRPGSRPAFHAENQALHMDCHASSFTASKSAPSDKDGPAHAGPRLLFLLITHTLTFPLSHPPLALSTIKYTFYQLDCNRSGGHRRPSSAPSGAAYL